MNVLLAAALAGCGGKPFEYHSQNEIPKGPGLFSGESGGFVYDSNKKVKTDPPSAVPQVQTAASDAASAPSGEFREFQEFQEFRQWKETSKDTPEFREFQDWREWKAYRTWKGRQPK